MPIHTQHLFTVDVEEYFQVSAFDALIARDAWPSMPSRLAPSCDALLELLARRDVRGTFFTLGWIAEHHPQIIRRIADAGHEIASHGYWHERVAALSPARFRADVRRAKAALEQCVGVPVIGYRAPSFSIVPGCEWALDVLIEEGHRYDSSLFPIARRGYGYANALAHPHRLERMVGTIAEYPPATLALLGARLPAAGGGYLRHFPLAVVRRAFHDATRAGIPATFYIHPWEVDPAQPRLDAPMLTRVRHYRGLGRTLARIDALLGEFRFGTIAAHLDASRAPSLPMARLAAAGVA